MNEQCCIWKSNKKHKEQNQCKTCSNKKDYLKWGFKPSYMSHKTLDNDLVAIRNNKFTVTLNKPAYIRMCILELSKVRKINVRIPL